MTNERFAGLRDIASVERFSPEHDWKCFFDLATVLDQQDKSNRFVITLLHSHFSVDDDEALVEHTDTSKRLVIKKVRREEDVRRDAMPCVNWRFTERGLLPLEYTASNEQYDGAVLTDGDDMCLSRVRSVLSKYGALNRFGAALFSQHLLDPRSEILLERANADERLLTSEVIDRREAQSEQSLETCWHVRPNAVVAISKCIPFFTCSP